VELANRVLGPVRQEHVVLEHPAACSRPIEGKLLTEPALLRWSGVSETLMPVPRVARVVMTPTNRVLLAVALLLAVPLVGCATDEAPGGSDDGTGEEDPAPATAPRWNLGDAWTFSIDTHGFPETTTTMMVYNETADLYRIGSTDEETALQHAVFEVNPQLGRLQKGNLAVFEKGQPRSMYDFPIEDGKTWQTSVFVRQHEGQLDAEATYSEAIETPMGTFEGYEITASNDAGFQLTYDYVPEVKWFTKLVVEDADGTQLHDLRLTDHQEETSGTGYFVRPDKLHEATYESDGCAFPSGCQDNVLVDGASAKGGEYGAYDLVAYNVQVEVESDDDRASIEIADGEGNEIYSRQDVTESQGSEFQFETTKDFEPGDWTIDVQAENDVWVKVQLAGGWSYSGTV